MDGTADQPQGNDLARAQKSGIALHGRKHFISIVDASERHRQQVSDALLSFYGIEGHADATNALASLSLNTPSLVIVGDQVGAQAGVRFIKRMREVSVLNQVPILFICDKFDSDQINLAMTLGANGHLVKPYRRSVLIKSISSLLNASVEKKWDALPESQRLALKGTVEAFNSMSDIIASGEPLPYDDISESCQPLIEAVSKQEFKSLLNNVKDHDNYSYAHSLRVATLLSLFGTAAGIKGDDLLTLASGGLLHDAGKMSIPHDVLNKPGKLDEAEFAIMKSHVPATVSFLHTNPNIPKPVIDIASQHHEKINGTGYPKGLKGSELNELARMAAIVDVFSALTDRRVYKPPMEPEKAIRIMTDEMTSHLDQHFLKLFQAMLLDATA
ncbi:MAG TPA: HD domain-containing phosphohydrolase [Candidatus Sulfotelmatobacter sp.]|jgi:HD-GYP domain-containing protein (c-di-GMP phosphodiesterase class II)|nr:HD domain-containing phosphohydrolase [Candidatus Sulfotelmatobacter sp.]